jgi:hypothetical protein
MKRLNEIEPEHGGNYGAPKWKPISMKKPDREFCKQELLSRLSLKRNAPNDFSDPRVLGYVIDSLVGSAQSEEHVLRILEICEQREYFPDGYTIRQIAGETRVAESVPWPECQKCDGFGFLKPVQRGEYSGIPTNPDGTPIRCGCWREVEKS